MNGSNATRTSTGRPGRIVRARCVGVLALAIVAIPSAAIPFPGGGLGLAAGVVVDRPRGEVRVVARVASTSGFLEQLVCLAGTREHESLLSTAVPPSVIHAGLLALGLEPGRPGRWWTDESGELVREPPSGPELEAFVRRIRGGRVREFPLRSWTSADDGSSLASPLVFAGSEFRPNPPSLARILGPGEHYVADFSGSVIGLATFGDELIAVAEVHPHREDVAAPMYRSRTEAMPGPGTPVTLILRPAATRPELVP